MAALQAIENQKWAKEHDTYEDRIQHLEADLALAQQAHLQLDEQKQENLMLKETIDRMRFDMDELRNAMTSAVMAGGSGVSSAANSISKSLGAELVGKMKVQWGMEEVNEEEEPLLEAAEEDKTVKRRLTVVSAPDPEGTDGEDVIQTIITRKTRVWKSLSCSLCSSYPPVQKVASRANKGEARRFEVFKEYSDAYTQHEASEVTSSKTIQTDVPITAALSIQTDEPTPMDIEIQTDEPESGSSTPYDESMASSSTVLSPTPKPQTDLLHPQPHDLPPAYNQISSAHGNDDPDWLRAAAPLKMWHKGAKIPPEGIPRGISQDAVEEWKALKKELGIDCIVIDKVISTSEKTGLPRAAMGGRHAHSTTAADAEEAASKGRFYNIYNTYVYGAGRDGSTTFPTQFVLGIGATALMFLAISPYMVPHYAIPGGPTYYDRTVWHSFNSMQAAGEGFSADGTATVWSFLGRVGGGAARIARGWPT